MQLDEGIIDSDDLDIIMLDGVAEDDAADTPKAVDTYFGNHFDDLSDEIVVW